MMNIEFDKVGTAYRNGYEGTILKTKKKEQIFITLH